MYTHSLKPIGSSGGFALLRIVSAFPLACFTGAVVTDLAYWGTADMIWADFSAWLLAFGMATGVLAAVVGLVDLARHRQVLPMSRAWPVVLGSVIALGLGFLDNLVHSRDAWTSVVPGGLVLSVLTAIVALATGWLAVGRLVWIETAPMSVGSRV